MNYASLETWILAAAALATCVLGWVVVWLLGWGAVEVWAWIGRAWM